MKLAVQGEGMGVVFRNETELTGQREWCRIRFLVWDQVFSGMILNLCNSFHSYIVFVAYID